MNKIINWKRFWCKRSGTINLIDNGFLYDPESEYAKYYSTDVVAFKTIQDTPCLVLLGEPGIGKTTTINSEFSLLKKQINNNSDVLTYINLNEYGDEIRFINDVFESDVIKNLESSDSCLHLWLDSFDECALIIRKLPIIFRNQLKALKNYKDQFKIRISCRTGEWPENLIDEFNDFWGKDNVGIYELCPLRRVDVELYANENQINASIFIENIIKKEIQPLAITPLTLNFLIDDFKVYKTLPDTKTELFVKGCKHLATESNPDRNISPQPNYLSPARRLSIASRIAALMVFCNRNSIQIRSNESSLERQSLLLSDIGEGEEISNGEKFSFNEKDVVETITQTSLFTGRGPNQFGFAHQSYLEFLAARYLALHQLSIEQIKSLIQISNDPDQMVIPQLKNTVGWLNSIMPEILSETIRTDPQAILSGDVESLEMKYRKDLVESLLTQYENQKILEDIDWGHYTHYEKLNHNDLAAQLKPYIIDKNKYYLVRRVAIDIAYACKTKELQNILADIALDSTELLHIRERAAYAVEKIANDNIKLKFKTIAADYQADDKDDQLKGIALRMLWPKFFTAQELFDALTPSKNANFYGRYSSFLITLPKFLTEEHFPIALKWVIQKQDVKKTHLLTSYDKLSESILFYSCKHLNNPQILDAYVEAIIPRLENYLSIYSIPSGEDDAEQFPNLSEETSKNLIRIVVKKVSRYKKNLLTERFNKPQFIHEDDLEWLLDELNNESDDKKQEIWAQIIFDNYRWSDNVENINLILMNVKTNTVLAEKFKSIFDPIDINSDQANQLKEYYKEELEWQEKHKEQLKKKNTKLVPTVSERIKSCLERLENGQTDGLWQMCLEMTLDEDSKFYGHDLNSDLTREPGWAQCDEETIRRIIKAAKKYIIDNSISTVLWAEDNRYYKAAIAGYKAFILLKKLDPNFLDTLDVMHWKRWASVIIEYPEETSTVDRDKTYINLIEQSYSHAPQEIINTLLSLIEKENKQNDALFSLRKIEDCKKCLDERMQNALFEKMKDETLKDSCFQEILTLLLSLNNTKVITYPESFLKLPLKDELKEKAKTTALSLILNSNKNNWDKIWNFIQNENDLGKELFLLVPNESRIGRYKYLPECIGEKNTANLFIWLSKNFPKEEDPVEIGAHFIGSRETIADYRDGMLRYLHEIGTKEAIEALNYIKQEMPNLNLHYHLVKAWENFRRKNWTPLKPIEFLSHIKNSNNRLILSAGHLVDVIIESLNRLEIKLQGETSQAFVLWDEQTDKNWKPKEEKYLSNYVKKHLEEDLSESGIIFSREVEISDKQGNEGKEGEKIDIYASYFIPSNQKKVTLIIEVKGCWNSAVKTDIKDQLLDRYLDKPELNHGIYLVGWYLCKQWKESNSKKNKTGAKTLEDVREEFQKQALVLSTNQKLIKSIVLNCALRERN